MAMSEHKVFSNTINIYCDESCHLENDPYKVFVLGAIWCPRDSTKEIFRNIRNIKMEHDLPGYFEVKWTKVSPAKVGFYLDLIDYFFHNDDLRFRGLVVKDKSILDHGSYFQTHDDWYYKMYYELINKIFDFRECRDSAFRIYLDKKDTRSNEKISKLHKILCNSLHDFNQEQITRIQAVDSKEIELSQLTDLLTGALGYVNRGLTTSYAKKTIIKSIQSKSRLSLKYSTGVQVEKFNLLMWRPS